MLKNPILPLIRNKYISRSAIALVSDPALHRHIQVLLPGKAIAHFSGQD
ncbi:hypothetical protein [Coleofasciculus sp. FACHB-SPT9]|nr:hypothetical protein [Coleofasciculus sp. FACHB-SPT9]MBD1892921.1 hypothetical protein [Coleofasciculus sp. FACHB-SPT9]